MQLSLHYGHILLLLGNHNLKVWFPKSRVLFSTVDLGLWVRVTTETAEEYGVQHTTAMVELPKKTCHGITLLHVSTQCMM